MQATLISRDFVLLLSLFGSGAYDASFRSREVLINKGGVNWKQCRGDSFASAFELSDKLKFTVYCSLINFQ